MASTQPVQEVPISQPQAQQDAPQAPAYPPTLIRVKKAKPVQEDEESFYFDGLEVARENQPWIKIPAVVEVNARSAFLKSDGNRHYADLRKFSPIFEICLTLEDRQAGGAKYSWFLGPDDNSTVVNQTHAYTTMRVQKGNEQANAFGRREIARGLRGEVDTQIEDFIAHQGRQNAINAVNLLAGVQGNSPHIQEAYRAFAQMQQVNQMILDRNRESRRRARENALGAEGALE